MTDLRSSYAALSSEAVRRAKAKRPHSGVHLTTRRCLAFDGLRQYLRFRRQCGERVSLAAQRDQFSARWQALGAELAAVQPEPGRRDWRPGVALATRHVPPP